MALDAACRLHSPTDVILRLQQIHASVGAHYRAQSTTRMCTSVSAIASLLICAGLCRNDNSIAVRGNGSYPVGGNQAFFTLRPAPAFRQVGTCFPHGGF